MCVLIIDGIRMTNSLQQQRAPNVGFHFSLATTVIGVGLFSHQIYGMENGMLNFHGRLQDVKEFNPDLFTVWQEKIKKARSPLAYFSFCLDFNDRFTFFTPSVVIWVQL